MPGFAAAAIRSCASSGFSAEASARAKGGVTTAAAPIIYQPIKEMLPEVVFPTISPIPTAEPSPLPEMKETSWVDLIINNWPILVILAILLVLARWLFSRRKPGSPPEITPPSPPTPSSPPPPVVPSV